MTAAELKSKALDSIFNIIVTIIASFLLMAAMLPGRIKDQMNQIDKEKAPYTYVDEKDRDLKNYVDRQDDVVLKSIDGKLDLVIKMLDEKKNK